MPSTNLSLDSEYLANISGEHCLNATLADSMSAIKTAKTVACSVIMMFSLLGNSAIVAIVVKYKTMQTTTNFLITNMAVSDLIVTVFGMPRELVETFFGHRRWVIDGLAGTALCKFVYFFQDVSTAVSIQSLVILAVDRYRGVVYPFHCAMITPKLCKLIIPSIWIIGIGLHGIYFYTVRVNVANGIAYCIFSWAPNFDDRQTQEYYFLATSSMFFFLPLVLLTAVYTRIIFELKKRKLPGQITSILARQRHIEDTKIIKKLIAIVVIFFICVGPITVFAMIYYFVWDWSMPCEMINFSVAFKYVFHANAAFSPCVYISLNDRYRQGLKRILKYSCREPHEKQKVCLEMSHIRKPAQLDA